MIQHLVADGGICVVLYTLQHPIKSACGADRQMLPNSVAETNTFMGFFGIQLSREFQNATHGKWYSKLRIIHMTVVRRENLKDHFGHHIVYSVELCSECWSPISNLHVHVNHVYHPKFSASSVFARKSTRPQRRDCRCQF